MITVNFFFKKYIVSRSVSLSVCFEISFQNSLQIFPLHPLFKSKVGNDNVIFLPFLALRFSRLEASEKSFPNPLQIFPLHPFKVKSGKTKEEKGGEEIP